MIKYTGREQDLEDLYYYRNRYYRPSVGRFISEDPIGLAGGSNLYTYVENNPINLVDLDGLRVINQGSSPSAASALDRAYKKVKKTPKGRELCETLENSPDDYILTDKANNFLQRGDKASYSAAFKTIVVNPNYHPILNTVAGPQRASTAAVLGHEIGHAATGAGDDGPGDMDNVSRNENPVRDALGLSRRTSYP